MKMLKKLLAVVLTGAMALTLLTACGGNAVTEKDIADVMSDMAKAEAEGTNVTFTPRAKEREMAQKLAALLESHSENDSAELSAKIQGILGIDVGGVNEKSRYVWAVNPVADGIGAAGQAHQIMRWIVARDAAMNEEKLEGTNPANDRYMGTALCKMVDENGQQVTVRVIVVTAEAEVDKDKD